MAIEQTVGFLREWALVISGLGSLVLTFALVLLYFRQTTILDEQRELLQHELNREVRQQHTETLRERVQIWLGEKEPLREGSELFESANDNLPAVTWTDIQSAPNRVRTFPEDRQFSVFPEPIRDDRYLSDLLENHAHDLQQKVKKINRMQSQFERLKSEFLSRANDGESRETDQYRIKPTNQFREWLFERGVRLARRERDDKERLKYLVSEGVKETTGAADEDSIKYRGEPPDTSPLVYSLEVKGMERSEFPEEYREQAEDEIVDILQNEIEEIDYREPYTFARDAADRLDILEEEIRELKMMLIEYEGKPIYSGECEYLHSAMV